MSGVDPIHYSSWNGKKQWIMQKAMNYAVAMSDLKKTLNKLQHFIIQRHFFICSGYFNFISTLWIYDDINAGGKCFIEPLVVQNCSLSSFCVLMNGVVTRQWPFRIRDGNSVSQAELFAILWALEYIVYYSQPAYFHLHSDSPFSL